MAKPKWMREDVKMFVKFVAGRAFWPLIGFGFIVLSSSPALAQQTRLLYTASHNAKVQSLLTREPVSFTIDTTTVSNWDTISVGMDFVDITGKVSGSVIVDMPTEENPIVSVSLLADDVSKAGGGEDVLLLGKKEKLEFSAENTAKAELVRLVVLFNPHRLEDYLLAYDLFPKHAKFADLVAIFASRKGFPVDEATAEEIGTLQAEILLDVMTRRRREEDSKKLPHY